MRYLHLLRLHKPIGILLLLWPTLWALWLASRGVPDALILGVFVAGVVLMRSAGCVVNDLTDRDIDGKVARTCERPLVTGLVSVKEAIAIAALLSGMAFVLVLFCNALTIALAIMGAVFVLVYPRMKRFTHLPQLGLGVAFSWSVPMAFAAVTGGIEWRAWVLFGACLLWPIIYDTQYAMVDRSDDQRIGIKSTAILFGAWDRMMIGMLQICFILALFLVGVLFAQQRIYFVMLVLASLLFVYQQWLIRNRDRERCFAAFLNNNWVGLLIFIGIYLQ